MVARQSAKLLPCGSNPPIDSGEKMDEYYLNNVRWTFRFSLLGGLIGSIHGCPVYGVLIGGGGCFIVNRIKNWIMRGTL